MKTVLQYWPILLVIMNCLAVWIAWSLRQLATHEVVVHVDRALGPLVAADARLAEEVEDQGGRLAKLEESVKHLPRREDIERLAASVAGVDKAVAAQNATLQSVKESGRATQDAVDRLYRYFMEKDK
ncbi:MAG: DUF2730 family protein [Reyranella sp.]|uniref:DUF2730 family protein n=1 Tax=Reyranella sp. TaxID=1929291 RepID=UPI00272F78A9|nr:DUF2730 family protein [Reyranella sp.]MDP1962401.1 DUF2730 family protein [Reyranella sp.]MDP2376545.1 DUF2730 family protein [Reyranella sp.]